VDEVVFQPISGMVPVFESKMIHLFDHRFADIINADGRTKTLTDSDKGDPTRLSRPRHLLQRKALDRFIRNRWNESWLIVWRDTARNDDVRTLISCIIPYSAPTRNNLPVLAVACASGDALCLVSILSSFMVDYITRLKVAGAHVTRAHIEQLPVPGPEWLDKRVTGFILRSFLMPRAVELVYTCWDLEGLSPGIPPYRWNSGRRSLLAAELDAAVFHLYGSSKELVEDVMDSFPIVQAADIGAFGEYRTKRLVLERFDAMAEAHAAGKEYQSVLDPPPAHPSLTHDSSTRPAWADWYLGEAK
jgi:hypothetical protein